MGWVLRVVAIGFIAARMTNGCPFVMPPSIPPARLDDRMRSSPSKRMGSWTRVPLRLALSNAGPISTPFIAWTPSTAAPRRASNLRSQWTCEPNPGGKPRASTSITPPSVSRACIIAWMRSRIKFALLWSGQRTSSSSANLKRSINGIDATSA